MENNNDNFEEHKFLPSGEWNGFYCYNHDGLQHKMSTALNFKNGIVSGSGIDDVSSFTWKGKYSIESFKTEMVKSYSTHSVFYYGDIDENGIWGIWKISFPDTKGLPQNIINYIEKNHCTGGFHIWPKKQSSAENSEKLEEIIKSEKLEKMFEILKI